MPAMRFLASADQMRALDASLESDFGLRPVELMEIAGSGSFLLLRELAERARRLVVVAGPGQNGGDGFVIARYAAASGISTSVFAMKKPESGTPSRIQLDRLAPFAVPISTGEFPRLEEGLAEPDILVVDALFGTGLKPPLRPDAARWIEAVSRTPRAIVSIDLPSGLDGDTGVSQAAVRASWTLTIGAMKPGLLTKAGAELAGKVSVVPLPYPPERVHDLRRVES
jgi:NAD(P)H-hydrate epimerase